MKQTRFRLYLGLVMFSCGPLLWAQQPPQGAPQKMTVPHMVQFSGMVNDAAGRPVAGITFALYKDQAGGAPIWLETQNVPLDETGRYTVLLGATRSDGLPTELFTSGEARWLGIQPEGQAEQPRVLLLSVPYALKAADAETVGGLPPSAFVLAAPPAASDNPAVSSAANVQPAITPALAGSGTLDFIPLWTPDGSTLGNSILFQNASSQIGVGTQTPSAKLDIAGSAKVRGALLLPAAGAATASAGTKSQPLNLAASAFDSGTATAVNQTFSWRAEPVGNDTASASGSLNLLFGVGSSTPAETGLQISNGGLFTFAPGQTFPGTITGVTAGTGLAGGGTSGNVKLSLLTSCGVNQVLQWNGSAWVCGTVGTGSGTITGVTAGTDLTGGGTTGNVTLNLDTTKVPQLNTANTFTANQSVTGNLSVTGGVSGAAGTFSGNLSTTGNLTGQTGVLKGASATPLMQISQSGTGAGMSVVASGNDGIDISTTAPSKSAVSAQVTGTGAVAINGFANNTGEIAVQGTGGGTAVRGQATAPGATAVAGSSVGGLSGEFSGGPVAIFPSATFSSAFMLQLQSNNQLGEIIQAPVTGVGSALDLQTTGTGGTQWELLATGNTSAQGVGKLNIRNVTTGQDVFTIDSSGQVALGTPTPNIALTVNGGVAAESITAANNSVIEGDLSTGLGLGEGLHCNSDANILGDLNVNGNVSKGGGSFLIDHPLDPANKYLYHSFVESPDMMNIYNGNITTDGSGYASITLPDWFEALNRDFRYQLTTVGQLAQAWIAAEVANHAFAIRTDRPNVKVSWQVTGIRQDAWANAHRIPLEMDKDAADQGHYLHPELFGHAGEPNIPEIQHSRLSQLQKPQERKR